MSELILNAEYEITEEQYCANGDHQDWLVECYNRKVMAGRLMAVTDDEFQAKLAETNSFRESLGGSNGQF